MQIFLIDPTKLHQCIQNLFITSVFSVEINFTLLFTIYIHPLSMDDCIRFGDIRPVTLSRMTEGSSRFSSLLYLIPILTVWPQKNFIESEGITPPIPDGIILRDTHTGNSKYIPKQFIFTSKARLFRIKWPGNLVCA